VEACNGQRATTGAGLLAGSCFRASSFTFWVRLGALYRLACGMSWCCRSFTLPPLLLPRPLLRLLLLLLLLLLLWLLLLLLPLCRLKPAPAAGCMSCSLGCASEACRPRLQGTGIVLSNGSLEPACRQLTSLRDNDLLCSCALGHAGSCGRRRCGMWWSHSAATGCRARTPSASQTSSLHAQQLPQSLAASAVVSSAEQGRPPAACMPAQQCRIES